MVAETRGRVRRVQQSADAGPLGQPHGRVAVLIPATHRDHQMAGRTATVGVDSRARASGKAGTDPDLCCPVTDQVSARSDMDAGKDVVTRGQHQRAVHPQIAIAARRQRLLLAGAQGHVPAARRPGHGERKGRHLRHRERLRLRRDVTPGEHVSQDRPAHGAGRRVHRRRDHIPGLVDHRASRYHKLRPGGLRPVRAHSYRRAGYLIVTPDRKTYFRVQHELRNRQLTRHQQVLIAQSARPQ
jgi:hypothetical protein